jgi:hypothetical protein
VVGEKVAVATSVQQVRVRVVHVVRMVRLVRLPFAPNGRIEHAALSIRPRSDDQLADGRRENDQPHGH